jgi:hypothetical protein
MTLSENSVGGEKELLMGGFGGEEVGQYQPPDVKLLIFIYTIKIRLSSIEL